MNKMNIETTCVQGGEKKLPDNNGVNTPIITSTSFDYRTQVHYPRIQNITGFEVVNDKIALLEGAEKSFLYGSGMGAISAVFLGLLQQGDDIIAHKEIYGGAYNFIVNELPKFGIGHQFIDVNDIEALEANHTKKTKLIYFETPTNPQLDIIDIKKLNGWCKQKNIISVIDNTFCSPIVMRPIENGIDIVLHSGTKYLSGHSDIIFGCVSGKEEHISKIIDSSINLGSTLNAQDVYLIERSLKTLALRVRTQNDNAMFIANELNQLDQFKRVLYPGLSIHPRHEVAKQQMDGFGAILSFELKEIDYTSFLDKLKLIKPAVSLGGVESTIVQPSFTSHQHMPEEEKEILGITDQLLRLSVGIESKIDLLNDIKQALN